MSLLRVTASDFYTYHRPSTCDLRVYLRERDEKEAPLGPYEEVIFRLGKRHERKHLESLQNPLDLSDGSLENRIRRTTEAIKSGVGVIYQGAMRSEADIDGLKCEVVGEPDFLIKEAGGFLIRDSKISRRINEKDHPEIICQLGLYGWLFEQTLGYPPVRLEVHSGPGDIVSVPDDGGHTALGLLATVLRLKTAKDEFYAPVGWTKCGNCGFYQRCWPRAEEQKDVALISGVDQGLARALHDGGVRTIEELLSQFDEQRLASFQRPWGKRSQSVGKAARSILQRGQALASGKDILLQKPQIKASENYVMFDVEGLPPQLDELQKVYLWGLQVYGERASEYKAALAGFGPGGDQEGWDSFLAKVRSIFDDYGDLPFVHWHHYEKTCLDMYINRFGDRDGLAARVKDNLVDLLPVTQKSLALPLPSYSLKVIEKYVGFKRSLEEGRGDWAMAKYIEATESEDESTRNSVMDEIVAYNREDLEATWAVLNWLRGKG